MEEGDAVDLYAQIQLSDPSLCNLLILIQLDGGFRIVLERDAPLDIRITDPRILATVGQEVGSRETVNFKLLVKEPAGSTGEDVVPDVVKLEISSNHDYFFLYKHQ